MEQLRVWVLLLWLELVWGSSSAGALFCCFYISQFLSLGVLSGFCQYVMLLGRAEKPRKRKCEQSWFQNVRNLLQLLLT
ncbi:uncharacterized protein ASCRUDRAFT_78428 [Ascoidea rubescens DSM 1968]|uniref:Secreted protein n=1 Tax=Ascoidea rubescens DSM 1968 TaxID=1344418 RepID=A0A1D2VNU1_9ASCO|nr:hypothetical protein ASCRUDRAFT_78428 [Ascoidea rubescens DSM 1968]ODV63273.1 hypothetical protein ASCRUDRAFT_78428 [Ascoidea rubescens DSM 1968]